MMHYQIGPERQWWTASVASWGLRYSFGLAAFTALGVLFQFRRLRYGKQFFMRHEWLMLCFVGITWLSVAIGFPPPAELNLLDYPPLKLTKVMIFCLIMTHVMTTPKNLRMMLWAFVIGAFFLGWQSYQAPATSFTSGDRLNDIGGPDFSEANFLGAFLLACLPITLVLFLRSGWLGKAVCLASGVFTANGIILTRSRGAFLGAAGAMLFALIAAPKGYRLLVLIGLLVVGIGAYRLTDEGYRTRVGTVRASEEERDTSAQSRVEIWQATTAMFQDHPFGIGAGNFVSLIGRYSPKYPNRDAHSLYVRCYSELGIQGIALMIAVLASAFHMLWQIRKQCLKLPNPYRDDLLWSAFAVSASLVSYLVCSITITTTYTEVLYWLLAMPVCLWRVAENVRSELATVPRLSKEAGSAVSLRPA
jgi:O-antigen ligase